MTSVTVRIPEELKRELAELGVEVSAVTRSALEEEVKRLKRKRAERAAARLGRLLADVPDDSIVKAVKETRDER